MNNTSTFGLQFVVRHKSKKTEMAGIYLRITVDRKKVEVSTKLQCPVHLWGQNKERVKSDGKFNHHDANLLINENRSRVQCIYQELRLRNQLITPTIIKNLFLGNQEEKPTLIKLMAYHYDSQKEALNPMTLRHYQTTYRYLKMFLNQVKRADDIYLLQIDYKFICDYEAFLRNFQPHEAGKTLLNHNTVMHHLSRLRRNTTSGRV